MKLNKKLGFIASLIVAMMPKGSEAKLFQCVACPAGTYSDGTKSSCTKCDYGTYSHMGATTCTKCPSGQVSNQGASSCIDFSTGGTQISLSGGKGTLSPGVYRVELSGGKGGRGQGITCGWNTCYGGYGGNGYTNKEVFIVKNTTSYTYSIGGTGVSHGVQSRCYGGGCNATGGRGGTSSFNAPGVINISAAGGYGGGGACDTTWSCNGGGGGAGGNGSSGNGWIRLYKM